MTQHRALFLNQEKSMKTVRLFLGLARGIPYKCLPLDFMGFYAIVGMETDKNVKDVTKRYMVADIAARKDVIKNMTYSTGNFSLQKNCFLVVFRSFNFQYILFTF